MIKTSNRNGSSSPLQATLYYLRLKTHDDQQLFRRASDVSDAAPELQTTLARIVADELCQAETHHEGVSLELWILEPDALHAIVMLKESRPSQEITGKPRLLTSFVAELKTATAKRINLMRNQPGSSVWRRSYKEQRVDDEVMLARLRRKLVESDSIIVSG
ncbi:MAG: hypothetical protein WA783_11775 [Phormidesmis sp.]